MESDVALTHKRTLDFVNDDADNWKKIGKNIDPEQTKLNYLWKRYPCVFGNDAKNGKIIVENIENEDPAQTSKLNDLHFPFHSLWKRYPYIFGIEDDNVNFYDNFGKSRMKKLVSNSKNYLPPQLRKYIDAGATFLRLT